MSVNKAEDAENKIVSKVQSLEAPVDNSKDNRNK